MVRIEKIMFEGFKSFKRKVSIPFDSGFTVVTGPNGSGKTNIADAIYFVLGSGAAKSLRAKKAHELIFQGNQKKPASEYAKVVMHLDNRKKLIPLPEETVTVSRRVNRAGVSTYRINGRMTTKQEIMDLLALSGVTSDGHNMIQQGDVTSIVEMNPVERRKVIDEIAGITEYDEKKEKALKELLKVEEKVREAEIVLEQKDELMNRIKAERDAALKYRSLQDSLRLIAAVIILRNLKALEGRLQESEKSNSEKDAELLKITTGIKELERQISAKEAEVEAMTKQIMGASARMEETGRISELQTRLEMKGERIKMNSREIERITEMIESLSTLDVRESPAVKAVAGQQGVFGTFSQLVMVPPKYKVAVEVAAGSHLGDVVVDTHTSAIECIKYLKAGKIGRARFLPMNKLTIRAKGDLPSGATGWLSDLVHHDPKYTSVVNYVLGSTVCVNDIEKVREIMKGREQYRMVTLDGDLAEKGGAMTGGFFRRGGSSGGANINQYLDSRKNLERENDTLAADMAQLEKELKSLGHKGGKVDSIKTLEEKRSGLSSEADALRQQRDGLYEQRTVLQEETSRMSVRKAKYEANIEAARADWDRYKEMEGEVKSSEFFKQPLAGLDERKAQIIAEMGAMGPVNLKAIEDFETFKKEFDEFRGKVDKIIEEKRSIEDTIADIEKKKRETFTVTLDKIVKHFRQIYAELTDGSADLRLEDVGESETGLHIYASPPGKNLVNIDAMSTGEKTLTAFAFLFAIQNHKPAPFYILDEADAALDRSNTKRVAELVSRHSKLAQFIIVSHNDQMIREADQVYGVSMEDGESKVIGIKLPAS